MLTALKRIVPAAARRSIRQKLDDWKLRKAIQPLRREGKFTAEELADFHKAWGNEGFSADRRYLAETLRLIEQHRGPVLECGTGGTTVLAAVLAERLGFEIYSLEQDPDWSVVAQRALKYNHLSSVRILDAPLRTSGDAMWYDTSKLSLPRHFGVIVCDGPFIAQSQGEAIYRNWRYGVMPYLKHSGTTFGALLLDDVDDARAVPILERWRTEFNTTYEIIDTGPREKCAIVRSA